MTSPAMDPTAATFEVPVYPRLPFAIEEGKGVHVRGSDGRWYLDLYGGHAVALLGYRHPRLVHLLADQAHRLFFQTNAAEVPVRQRAAAALAGLAPAGLDRVFLVNSGAEANENALRLAFRATGRRRVVALEQGFHGRTAAASACTHGSGRWYAFPRAPFDVTFVPPGDAAALAAALDQDVAALILEPVQGMAGAVALDDGYLRQAAAACRAAGALLIADEVQCGMGRSGRAFAVQHAGVVPDLLTTAKGLAGGFPAGAVLMSEARSDTLGPGDLGTTFGGGPMAAAMIQAVVEELSAPGFLEQVAERGRQLQQRCRGGVVTAVQGRGLLVGLRTALPAKEVLAALRSFGILAGSATDPHVVRLMPPLILQEEHVDALADALSRIG